MTAPVPIQAALPDINRSDRGGSGPPEVPAAVLQEVSLFYGEVIGLSKVDITLKPGITGIVGPNGSGKSTLMRVLTGLMGPSEGTVRVFGLDPVVSTEARQRIGFVPATECFHEGLSGRRNLEVAFLAQGQSLKKARSEADRGLHLVGLASDGDRRYGAWSRGMRQRLKLALTLVNDRELVLLDEPFLGVDPPSRRYLKTWVQEMGRSGRTVLISSHVLHEIESLTDRVGVLARGRLLGFGRIQELLHHLRDQHPHQIRVAADQPRALAQALLELGHVRELKIVKDHAVEFVTEHPETAYRDLPAAVRKSGALVTRVETLDNGLEAVFRHITVGGTKRL